MLSHRGCALAPLCGSFRGSRTMTRLLIVDDCALVQSFIEHTARREHFETIVAPDGRTALRLMRELSPPIVTLDMHMPGMDGMECLWQIRAVWPCAKVLMISGDEDLEVKRTCLDLGAADYLAKPFDSHELAKRLRRLAAPRADRASHLTSTQPGPADADARRLTHPSVVPDRRASAALVH